MELIMRKKWHLLDFRSKRGPQQEYRETEEKCFKDPNLLRRILIWSAEDPEILSKGPMPFLIEGFYQKPTLPGDVSIKNESKVAGGQDHGEAEAKRNVSSRATSTSLLAVPDQGGFWVTVQSSDTLSPPHNEPKPIHPHDDSSLIPQIYVVPATPLRPTDHQQLEPNSLQAQFCNLLAQQDERQALSAKREQELEAKILELETGMNETRQECAKWKSEAKRLRAARDTAVEDANVVRADRTRWRNKYNRLCVSLEQNVQ